MEGLDRFLQYLNVVAFVALAFVTLRQWVRRRDDASRWAGLTFGSLAVVAVVGVILPDDADGDVADWVTRILIVVLLLFPYLLFRVATSFSERPNRVADVGALVLTAGVCVWGLLIPSFPDQGEPRTTAIQAFVYAILVQWVLLSGFVAVRFWRAGARQPDVARKRMRMLSIAATTMSLAIVVSGTTSTADTSVDVIIQTIALLAVFAFFLAFSPPAWLRTVWRRESQAQVRNAAMSVLAATSPEGVIEGVLPHAADVVGGRGIAMFDTESNLLGAHGFTGEDLAALDPAALDGKRFVKFEYPFGSLVLQTTRHTPFFGEDDISLLGAVGAVVNLALQRLDAVETEHKLVEARLRRRQALEINDNIVQRLAVAHYAFELGQMDEGVKATEAALKAAQRTISDLLGEVSDDELSGSPLTRNLPASG